MRAKPTPAEEIRPLSFVEQLTARKEASLSDAPPSPRTVLLSDRLELWAAGIDDGRMSRGVTDMEVAVGLDIRPALVYSLLLSEAWQYRWPVKRSFTTRHDCELPALPRGVLPRLWWPPHRCEGMFAHLPGEPDW